jgi:hypothetical protein
MKAIQQPTTAFLIRFVLLFGTIAKLTYSQEPCRNVNAISGYRLANHVLTTVNRVLMDRCTVLCEGNPDCYSINHYTTTKTCELNDISRKWPSASDFVRQDECFYMDMIVRQHNPCVHDKPCRNDGRCTAYPDNGTFRCDCNKRYTGKTCDEPRKGKKAFFIKVSLVIKLELQTYIRTVVKVHGLCGTEYQLN